MHGSEAPAGLCNLDMPLDSPCVSSSGPARKRQAQDQRSKSKGPGRLSPRQDPQFPCVPATEPQRLPAWGRPPQRHPVYQGAGCGTLSPLEAQPPKNCPPVGSGLHRAVPSWLMNKQRVPQGQAGARKERSALSVPPWSCGRGNRGRALKISIKIKPAVLHPQHSEQDAQHPGPS